MIKSIIFFVIVYFSSMQIAILYSSQISTENNINKIILEQEIEDYINSIKLLDQKTALEILKDNNNVIKSHAISCLFDLLRDDDSININLDNFAKDIKDPELKKALLYIYYYFIPDLYKLFYNNNNIKIDDLKPISENIFEFFIYHDISIKDDNILKSRYKEYQEKICEKVVDEDKNNNKNNILELYNNILIKLFSLSEYVSFFNETNINRYISFQDYKALSDDDIKKIFLLEAIVNEFILLANDLKQIGNYNECLFFTNEEKEDFFINYLSHLNDNEGDEYILKKSIEWIDQNKKYDILLTRKYNETIANGLCNSNKIQLFIYNIIEKLQNNDQKDIFYKYISFFENKLGEENKNKLKERLKKKYGLIDCKDISLSKMIDIILEFSLYRKSDLIKYEKLIDYFIVEYQIIFLYNQHIKISNLDSLKNIFNHYNTSEIIECIKKINLYSEKNFDKKKFKDHDYIIYYEEWMRAAGLSFDDDGEKCQYAQKIKDLYLYCLLNKLNDDKWHDVFICFNIDFENIKNMISYLEGDEKNNFLLRIINYVFNLDIINIENKVKTLLLIDDIDRINEIIKNEDINKILENNFLLQNFYINELKKKFIDKKIDKIYIPRCINNIDKKFLLNFYCVDFVFITDSIKDIIWQGISDKSVEDILSKIQLEEELNLNKENNLEALDKKKAEIYKKKIIIKELIMNIKELFITIGDCGDICGFIDLWQKSLNTEEFFRYFSVFMLKDNQGNNLISCFKDDKEIERSVLLYLSLSFVDSEYDYNDICISMLLENKKYHIINSIFQDKEFFFDIDSFIYNYCYSYYTAHGIKKIAHVDYIWSYIKDKISDPNSKFSNKGKELALIMIYEKIQKDILDKNLDNNIKEYRDIVSNVLKSVDNSNDAIATNYIKNFAAIIDIFLSNDNKNLKKAFDEIFVNLNFRHFIKIFNILFFENIEDLFHSKLYCKYDSFEEFYFVFKQLFFIIKVMSQEVIFDENHPIDQTDLDLFQKIKEKYFPEAFSIDNILSFLSKNKHWLHLIQVDYNNCVSDFCLIFSFNNKDNTNQLERIKLFEAMKIYKDEYEEKDSLAFIKYIINGDFCKKYLLFPDQSVLKAINIKNYYEKINSNHRKEMLKKRKNNSDSFGYRNYPNKYNEKYIHLMEIIYNLFFDIELDDTILFDNMISNIKICLDKVISNIKNNKDFFDQIVLSESSKQKIELCLCAYILGLRFKEDNEYAIFYSQLNELISNIFPQIDNNKKKLSNLFHYKDIKFDYFEDIGPNINKENIWLFLESYLSQLKYKNNIIDKNNIIPFLKKHIDKKILLDYYCFDFDFVGEENKSIIFNAISKINKGDTVDEQIIFDDICKNLIGIDDKKEYSFKIKSHDRKSDIILKIKEKNIIKWLVFDMVNLFSNIEEENLLQEFIDLWNLDNNLVKRFKYFSVLLFNNLSLEAKEDFDNELKEVINIQDYTFENFLNHYDSIYNKMYFKPLLRYYLENLVLKKHLIFPFYDQKHFVLIKKFITLVCDEKLEKAFNNVDLDINIDDSYDLLVENLEKVLTNIIQNISNKKDTFHNIPFGEEYHDFIALSFGALVLKKNLVNNDQKQAGFYTNLNKFFFDYDLYFDNKFKDFFYWRILEELQSIHIFNKNSDINVTVAIEEIRNLLKNSDKDIISKIFYIYCIKKELIKIVNDDNCLLKKIKLLQIIDFLHLTVFDYLKAILEKKKDCFVFEENILCDSFFKDFVSFVFLNNHSPSNIDSILKEKTVLNSNILPFNNQKDFNYFDVFVDIFSNNSNKSSGFLFFNKCLMTYLKDYFNCCDQFSQERDKLIDGITKSYSNILLKLNLPNEIKESAEGVISIITQKKEALEKIRLLEQEKATKEARMFDFLFPLITELNKSEMEEKKTQELKIIALLEEKTKQQLERDRLLEQEKATKEALERLIKRNRLVSGTLHLSSIFSLLYLRGKSCQQESINNYFCAKIQSLSKTVKNIEIKKFAFGIGVLSLSSILFHKYLVPYCTKKYSENKLQANVIK